MLPTVLLSRGSEARKAVPTGRAQCELGGVQSRSALPAGHPQDSLGMDLSSRRHPAPILAHGPPLPSAKSPGLASLARARALPASSALILPALPAGGPGLRQLPALTLVLPEPPRRAGSRPVHLLPSPHVGPPWRLPPPPRAHCESVLCSGSGPPLPLPSSFRSSSEWPLVLQAR